MSTRPSSKPPKPPIFEDACDYIDINGFDIVSYFIIGSTIISPDDMKGKKIISYIVDKEHVTLELSGNEKLVVKRKAELQVEKEGCRTKIVIDYMKDVDTFAITIEPCYRDIDTLVRTIHEICMK